MKDYYLKGEENFGFFSSIAYWLMTKLPSMKRVYDFVLDDISKNGFKEILDMGCGPGDIAILLARSGEFKEIYAVDPSIEMLKIAKFRSKKLKIKFVRGSSRNLKLNKKFDLIISSISFHHWADKSTSLRYLSQFLNNGGEIRIYEFERKKLSMINKYLIPSHSMTKEELIEVAKDSGLKVKRIVQKDGMIRASFTNYT